MAELDKWIEIAKKCRYLPENDLKKLCDIVCDLLIEESNIQPVSTPVTVCGDIHGQVKTKKKFPSENTESSCRDRIFFPHINIQWTFGSVQ